MSSDFGALLLRGLERQIGLPDRLAAAMQAKRPPSSIAHPLRDLLAPRRYPIASGYADGHDATRLRHAPRFPLRLARPPLELAQALARAPTFARLAHRVDRKALSRRTQALGDHCIARYPEPPAAIGLDLDHADAPTQGQQECAFYHHHSRGYGSLPLCIFAGPAHALVTAGLRPGKRPTGAENALHCVRLLASRRRHWPPPHRLGRGDSHCAPPAVLDGLAPRRLTDCVFGVAGNAVLLRHAAPVMQEARRLSQQRTARAQAYGERPPARSRC